MKPLLYATLLVSIWLTVLVDQSTQTCTEEFKRHFLRRHNNLRARHHVPALVFDDYLNNRAQDWADKMAEDGRVSTRRENLYGENLYVSWSTNGARTSAESLVQSWYDDIENYATYFGGEPDMDTVGDWGYFTQVVWRRSRRLGVGCARRGNAFYVVANYDPPGNLDGQFTVNVPAPRGGNWRNWRRVYYPTYPIYF